MFIFDFHVRILLFLFISALFVMNLWFDTIKYIDMYTWYQIGSTKCDKFHMTGFYINKVLKEEVERFE